jgi:1-acyl-sn-glycerol-3-phosphate acyltransferase
MTEKFARVKRFHLAITPEGTRKANPRWRYGFYHIAKNAQVPIVLVGIDYGTKTIISDKVIIPSGNMDGDIRDIKRYFMRFKGKHPGNFDAGEI